MLVLGDCVDVVEYHGKYCGLHSSTTTSETRSFKGKPMEADAQNHRSLQWSFLIRPDIQLRYIASSFPIMHIILSVLLLWKDCSSYGTSTCPFSWVQENFPFRIRLWSCHLLLSTYWKFMLPYMSHICGRLRISSSVLLGKASQYKWSMSLEAVGQYQYASFSCSLADRVFDPKSKTADIYDTLTKKIVSSAVHGFNGKFTPG